MAKNDTDERSAWVSTLLLQRLTNLGLVLGQCRSTVFGQCCSNVGSGVARFRERLCICRLNNFGWSQWEFSSLSVKNGKGEFLLEIKKMLFWRNIFSSRILHASFHNKGIECCRLLAHSFHHGQHISTSISIIIPSKTDACWYSRTGTWSLAITCAKLLSDAPLNDEQANTRRGAQWLQFTVSLSRWERPTF